MYTVCISLHYWYRRNAACWADGVSEKVAVGWVGFGSDVAAGSLGSGVIWSYTRHCSDTAAILWSVRSFFGFVMSLTLEMYTSADGTQMQFLMSADVDALWEKQIFPAVFITCDSYASHVFAMVLASVCVSSSHPWALVIKTVRVSIMKSSL